MQEAMNTQLNLIRASIAATACLTLAGFALAQGRSNRSRPFDTTMDGEGTSHILGTDYRFKRMQVVVEQNQRVTIRGFYGPLRAILFKGRANRWDVRGNRILVDIDSATLGRDDHPANGVAKIFLSRRNEFSSVTVDGRDRDDHLGFSLRFASTGVTSLHPDWDAPTTQQGNDRDRDDFGGRAVSGRYTADDRWQSDRGDWDVRYNLELSTDSDRATLSVLPMRDRGLPDDKSNRRSHGEILKYLQSSDVIQMGRWTQKGDQITISFDTIQTGGAPRSRHEKLVGRLRNGVLIIDDWNRDFYGHDARLAFVRNGGRS